MAHDLIEKITARLTHIISETNGLSLYDTLDLLSFAQTLDSDIKEEVHSFQEILDIYRTKKRPGEIEKLLAHPIGKALFQFFHRFPLRYREEHIHLTGSLNAEFIHPRLQKLASGPNKKIYQEKLDLIYGKGTPIDTVEDVDRLIRLPEGERFDRYLEILLPAKLILTNREAHEEAAYHLAERLWDDYNVGSVRIKFTLSRATTRATEQIPGTSELTSEDVVLGLHSGLESFRKSHPGFEFILSPCFRKEPDFYDAEKFSSKKDYFDHQVNLLMEMLKTNSQLRDHVLEVDTVGSEKELYRKSHFQEMKVGFRKLQSCGLKIRSHHGETWDTLRKGIQSVDNAMNIWHVDAIEHGLSLGINPNYYLHSIFQRVMYLNRKNKPIEQGSLEHRELLEMDWNGHNNVRDKLIFGESLSDAEFTRFVKTKFHMAREMETYQHDILNRMIDKELSVIALPSSNLKLTGQFADYKDHPFSWWEKKGVKLGVGTDNYITLSTNFIREMLILLFTDPMNLKITKLLMVCTGETKRPYLSQQLWRLRRETPLLSDETP